MKFSQSATATVYIFGDFNIHFNDWLTYSGETDLAGELLKFFCLKPLCSDN